MALASLPKIRPYLVLALGAFALVCWLIAIAADIATAESGGTKARMGVWFTCSKRDGSPASCIYNTDSDIDCGEAKDHFRALQAFLIMLLIVIIPIIVAAILEIVHQLSLPGNRPVPGPLGIATLYVILAAMGILFSLVAFAIDFAIPAREFCDASSSFSDAPNFTYSASAPFALIAWVTMIAILVVAILFPGPDDAIVVTNTNTKGAIGHGTANEPTAVPPARQTVPVVMTEHQVQQA